jgi:hypothetical protein
MMGGLGGGCRALPATPAADIEGCIPLRCGLGQVYLYCW